MKASLLWVKPFVFKGGLKTETLFPWYTLCHKEGLIATTIFKK